MLTETTYTDWHLNMTVLENNLDTDPALADLSDFADRYCEMLTSELERAYPGMEVEIDLQRNTSGACRGPAAFCDGADPEWEGELADDIESEAAQLSNTLWVEMVETEPTMEVN